MPHTDPNFDLPTDTLREQLMSRGRRWGTWISAVLIVELPALAGLAIWITSSQPVVATVVRADGTETRVQWRDPPGHTGAQNDDVLGGPVLDDAIASQETLAQFMTNQLRTRFGRSWSLGREPFEREPITFETENGWGGPSLLHGVNLPTWQSNFVPRAWADKQDAIRIIAYVTAAQGWSAPYLDQKRWPETDKRLIGTNGGKHPEDQVLVSGGVEGPHGQWLIFAFQDMSKDDANGTFATRYAGATDYGWEPNTLTIFFGANGLLCAEDRVEYKHRIAPFDTLPEAATLAD